MIELKFTGSHAEVMADLRAFISDIPASGNTAALPAPAKGKTVKEKADTPAPTSGEATAEKPEDKSPEGGKELSAAERQDRITLAWKERKDAGCKLADMQAILRNNECLSDELDEQGKRKPKVSAVPAEKYETVLAQVKAMKP